MPSPSRCINGYRNRYKLQLINTPGSNLSFFTVPNSPEGVHVVIESPQSVRVTWRSHPGLKGLVTRYMVKWLHVGNPADSNVDGHKIVNAGNPYRRETQVGGLKPYNMYSFMVREEVGQENWGKFSTPVDIIMPEDGTVKDALYLI